VTITYKINGVTLTNRVRLMEEGEGFVTAAERGTVATGGVLIDDDDATLTINGWQSFTVDDDEAFPYSRVFTGFIVERNIGRNARYRTSTARVHDCAILDVNSYLHLHVIRANAGKRAAETDVARVAWLLTSEALSSLVYDRGLVSTANAGTYLESDTRRRFADDVMGELAPSAVKNFFVYQDNATASPALFYGRDTLSAYASTLRISNVASDVDNVVTFAPSIDATMQRQPNDWYGGVSYGWRGDPIYVQSATTIAAMGILRDAVYDTDRVGLLATAQQTSKDWLNVRATEADFITVSLIVPSARINDIYAGQRIQVKFSHIPGYSSFTWTRVRRRAVKPVAPQFWEMRLELWVPAVPVSDAAITQTPTIVQSVSARNGDAGNLTLTLPSAVTAGSLLVIVARKRNSNGSGGLPTYLTVNTLGGRVVSFTVAATADILAGDILGPDRLNIMYVVAVGDEQTLVGGANKLQFTYYEIAGASVTGLQTLALSSQTASTSKSLGSFASASNLQIGGYMWDDPASLDQTVGSGWTQDNQTNDVTTGGHPGSLAMHATTKPTVAISGGSYEWGGAAIAFAGDLVAAPQPVTDWISESLGYGNGTKTAWTTTWPFDDGSLTVFVDRLDQTSAATITSAAAGTFTLAFEDADRCQIRPEGSVTDPSSIGA